ncbi:hypothetical protein [Streptomyces wuyuanensis]|uniref:hypothetical protein n=1 Tax=Streptomyces wuyuanensis TaxID=1196353 RepID=UPI00372259FC
MSNRLEVLVAGRPARTASRGTRRDHGRGHLVLPLHAPAPIDATEDLYDEPIDRETWLQRIEARKAYRLMPKELEDDDGYQRVMCPAEAAKAQCPI